MSDWIGDFVEEFIVGNPLYFYNNDNDGKYLKSYLTKLIKEWERNKWIEGIGRIMNKEKRT